MKLNIKYNSIRQEQDGTATILLGEEDLHAALLRHPKVLKKWATGISE